MSFLMGYSLPDIMTKVRRLQLVKQMSEDIQKWIRDNFELIEKIRNRFEKYFQLEQSLRQSNRSSQDEDVLSKIQNQWRKLNDLLRKQIPQRIPKVDIQTSKNLELLRLQALRIQNMFKNKFGEEKHNEFKLIETKEAWKNPVFISQLKTTEKQKTKVQYEEISDQNESKVKSSLIDQAPGEEQKKMIKSIEEGERRNSSRIIKVQAQQRRIKTCSIILICTLLLVILMSFIDIPLKTKLFTLVFQNDL